MSRLSRHEQEQYILNTFDIRRLYHENPEAVVAELDDERLDNMVDEHVAMRKKFECILYDCYKKCVTNNRYR